MLKKDSIEGENRNFLEDESVRNEEVNRSGRQANNFGFFTRKKLDQKLISDSKYDSLTKIHINLIELYYNLDKSHKSEVKSNEDFDFFILNIRHILTVSDSLKIK
ncbi:hypothetical protein BpHYR1_048086 [Brachionus plicatilis]|uniref:Uncharacterized protein n=1 Tax=Brachionus plicatilis TaxID=10195 RepID=A0A3M7PXG6_BRAPC|nr:hypothetical protein BpHYR1_048086 [Brachionus plicatilis]